MTDKNALASQLADSLNQKFKGQKVAYFLDGKDSIPTGRITEINGLSSTGKSLLGAHVLAETQKKGGVAVYIDTETSVSREFLQAIGCDVGNLLYLHIETVEEIFQAIEDIILKVREGEKDKHVTILIDSLAAASTKVEMEADYDKDGWASKNGCHVW